MTEIYDSDTVFELFADRDFYSVDNDALFYLAEVPAGAVSAIVENVVWDTAVVGGGGYVVWTTSFIDNGGQSYPGPGTFGVDTSGYRVQSYIFTRNS